MASRGLCLSVLLTACSPGGSAPVTEADSGSEGTNPEAQAICGANFEGRRVDVELDATQVGRVLEAGDSTVCAEGRGFDAREFWLTPAFIDSHVHLDYYRVADELPRSGIVATVDLAVPLDAMPDADSPLRQRVSGPMITAVGGYPTLSWGAGGYGLEITTPEEGVAAVDTVVAAGAELIKIPFTGYALLDDATVTAIVEAAHERGLLVAVHAMSDAQVLRAAQLGADILAHTPTEALSPESLDAWADRTVITTLAAFGTQSGAMANLDALRARGTQIVYGTDLGNSREVGISASELEALLDVGLSPEEIITAATETPAQLWNWPDLGRIEAGAEASLLLLSEDPLVDPETLASPAHVLIAGEWLEPPKDVPRLPGVGGG